MANTHQKKTVGSFAYHLWDFDVDGIGTAVPWSGGSATMGTEKSASFGGGTLEFEWSPDNVSWFLMPFSATANAPLAIQTIAPGRIRPVLTGATTPTIKAVLS